MDLIQVLILAVLQGLVEFLPISSSGHLILVPALLGWSDQGLAFDIAVHVGTLAAVVFYFRRDLKDLAVAIFQPDRPENKLAWALIIATLPLVPAGVLGAGLISNELRYPVVIAATTAGFGVLLWLADRFGRGTRSEQDIGFKDALLIGIGQAMALVPGTSRSGVTMTVGLALGLSRSAAARFSFIMAVPAVAAAGIWQIGEFAESPVAVPWGTLILASVVSGVTAFLAIAGFLRLIDRMGMLVFAVYRLLLAGVIVYVLV